MIKGVNKQIIEVSDPDNKYFEKAVLYIRPEYADVPNGKICSSAKDLVNKMSDVDLWSIASGEVGATDKNKTNKNKIVLSIVGSGVLIAGVLAILLTII